MRNRNFLENGGGGGDADGGVAGHFSVTCAGRKVTLRGKQVHFRNWSFGLYKIIFNYQDIDARAH